jgi:hypothetical protein
MKSDVESSVPNVRLGRFCRVIFEQFLRVSS